MSLSDYMIIAAVAIWFCAAMRSIIRNRGGCSCGTTASAKGESCCSCGTTASAKGESCRSCRTTASAKGQSDCSCCKKANVSKNDGSLLRGNR